MQKPFKKSLSLFSSVALPVMLGVGLNTLVIAAPLDLVDLPITSVDVQEPNLLLTIDRSPTMRSASSVDDIDWSTRASRAYQYNRFAYNPAYTYAPPQGFDGIAQPDAVFFNPGGGSFDFAGCLNSGLSLFDCIQEFIEFLNGNRTDAVDLSAEFLQITARDAVSTEFVDSCGDDNGAPLCTAAPAFYYQHTGGRGCDARKAPDDEGCYERVELTDRFSGENLYGRNFSEEQTNFANWYTYYLTRMESTKTVLSIAFAPENMPDEVRVGRQPATVRSQIQSGSAASPTPGVNSFTDAEERERFYDWLEQLQPASSERGLAFRRSLQQAGEFISTENAYRKDPRDANSQINACRRNEHVLIASGDSTAQESYARERLSRGQIDEDSVPKSLPDGRQYFPATNNLFPSSASPTAADIAFSDWANDAFDSGDDNAVPPLLAANQTLGNLTENEYFDPAIDPASWQHLRTSVIGLGVRGTLRVDSADDYDSLLAFDLDFESWDNPFVADNIVDDLVHAAVNSRGDFANLFDASPDTLIANVTGILSFPGSTGFVSAVATPSGSAASDELIFTSSFDTELGVGGLSASRFSDGSLFRIGEAGSACDEKIFGTVCEEVWDAAEKNTDGSPSFMRREIFGYDSQRAEGQRGIELRYTNLNQDQQALLDAGGDQALGEQRLNYVRGDTSQEIGEGGENIFRKRSSPSVDSGFGATYLGPVVNSSPLYVPNGESAAGVRTFNFSDTLESRSYSAFIEQVASRRPPLVLVGANDGMLHGFNASDSGIGGREEFAYVPNAIFEKLPAYSDPSFQYSAFVDGPLVFQDAFVDNAWRTLVVGGLRTGGQGYFALDISNAGTSFLDADELAMWEFTDQQDADLGYSFGEAQIVRSNNNGRWVVLVPSGYNSTESDEHVGSGRAYLFVLDAEDGSVIRKIDVGTADDNLDEPNGLSSVAAITVDDDINVEYAYAGDLKGRMWKFDLSSSSPSEWRAGLLYDAGDNSPITAKPAVGRRPDGGEGQIVYFGTGQLIAAGDASSSDQQAFFGILDNQDCRSVSSACVSSGLIRQSFSGGGSQRTVSSRALDFDNNQGFEIRLSRSGSGSERVIAAPVLIGATVAFITTEPSETSCGATAENFLYVVNRATGGVPPNPPLVDNQGQVLLSGGEPVVGIKLDNDYPISSIAAIGGAGGSVSFNTPDANPSASLGRTGRLRWRQLR